MDIRRDIKYAQEQLGIEKLRKHQVKPINSILEGNDTMVVAPTSSGKSAIYQIPALLLPGMTLVIEPTISLMHDQVNKLEAHKIKVARIDSSVSAYERSRILKRIEKGQIKILFVTPERLQKPKLLAAIKAPIKALDAMKEYAESSECLTGQILSALGEKMDKPCGSCTNCQKLRKIK